MPRPDEQGSEMQGLIERLGAWGRAEVVEAGAIRMALDMLPVVRAAGLSVPRIDWHGDDAVVFLWVQFGGVDCLTITDGQIGYMEERGGRIVKSGHSQPATLEGLAALKARQVQKEEEGG